MKPLSRRTFLRAAGATLALPFLDAMRPVFGAAPAVPRRIIAICTNLGVFEKNFFPAESGREYTLTPYLEALKDFRKHFTVFSGTSHPDDKIIELKNLELAEFQQLNSLLTRLQSSREGDSTLLYRTQVLYGSNLGNGNNHDTKNLPMLLAGGGFKHAQHLAFDKTNNYRCPIYLSPCSSASAFRPASSHQAPRH